MRIPSAILALAAACTISTARAETPAELTDRLLSAGKLAEAESSLAKTVEQHPDDAEARFGLARPDSSERLSGCRSRSTVTACTAMR